MFLKLIYIIIIAISFTNTFQGQVMPFYLKYFLAIIWILIFLLNIIRTKKSFKKSLYYFKMYSLPYVIIFLWSIFCFFVNGHFEKQYITRAIGHLLYLIITYLAVVATVHFFGRKAIKYSLIAMFISVLINLGLTIKIYGMSSFIIYIQNIFDTSSFKMGTTMHAFAGALEVQDITMAAGLYILYYLFFYKKNEVAKENKAYLIISIICFLIGFKRTGLLSLLMAIVIYLIVRKKSEKCVSYTNIITIALVMASLIYIIFIKYDILSTITTYFDINTMGRVNIYKELASYMSLAPWFIGQGFMYVDKVMFDSIGFVSHTIIGKNYSELGFIPFFIWVYYFSNTITKKIIKKYKCYDGIVYLVCAFYIFSTFFFENTVTLFCVQYSFMLIPLAANFKYEGS